MMRVCVAVSALLAVIVNAACGGSNTPPDSGARNGCEPDASEGAG
jgi:hypothetical protein